MTHFYFYISLIVSFWCFVNGKLIPDSFEHKQDHLDSSKVRCVLDHRVFLSGATIRDGCNVCKCLEGVIKCTETLEKGCFYYQGQTTPPPPGACRQESKIRFHGEEFSAEDDCNKCLCQQSEISCIFDYKLCERNN